MRRGGVSGAILLACILWPGPARAQDWRARSTEYLTVAGVDDVRAAWVNPAGLARVLEASIMAEVVVDRIPEASLSQYTLGFNSRGFSVSYARDRTPDSATVSLTRFALGLSFGRGSAGVGVTLFRAGGREEGVDLGFGYRLTRDMDVAAAVRNIARPLVRGAEQPVVALVGARWGLVPSLVSIEAEAAATDRGSGFSDPRYNALLRLTSRARSPIHVLTGVAIGANRIERWIVGIGVGNPGWLGAVGGASRALGLGNPDRFSVTGLASHRGQVGQTGR